MPLLGKGSRIWYTRPMEWLSTLLDVAGQSPRLSAALTLFVAWSLATFFRYRSTGSTLSSTAQCRISHEEQMRAAREIQQKRLEEAALAKRQPPTCSVPHAERTTPQTPTHSIEADEPPVKIEPKKRSLSTTERLARIEKGKGTSSFNHFMPQSRASSAGSSFAGKKGGG
ncbi:MAG: hypothetical protein SGPRY_003783 [Prymnesium sp.]